jgi:hypothetical protein
MLYRNILYPDTYVLVILPKNMLGEIPRSQLSFTMIYYDQDGNVCAVGAEAVREGIEVDAEDSQWTKAEWQDVTQSSLLSVAD